MPSQLYLHDKRRVHALKISGREDHQAFPPRRQLFDASPW